MASTMGTAETATRRKRFTQTSLDTRRQSKTDLEPSLTHLWAILLPLKIARQSPSRFGSARTQVRGMIGPEEPTLSNEEPILSIAVRPPGISSPDKEKMPWNNPLVSLSTPDGKPPYTQPPAR